MDPLTITLAVISLATAIKDMVELGQKIHESFAKVSKNLRKAQHVAKDIVEMVEKIKVFYENHEEVLDKTERFRVALLGLLDKFKSFERSILPLLPKTGRRRVAHFMRGWWNNNKIEGSISDLKSDIMQVMLEYMMDSAMRAEVKLETMHQETSRGVTGITQGLEVLEVVRRDVSALRITAAAITTPYSHDSSETMSDELDRNIIKFALSTRSTSTPMLRTPNVITEELMTTAYIKLQVDKIALTFEKMSPLSPKAATISINFPLSTIFEQASMSMMHLRHDVVRHVTSIRDLLDTEHVQTVSIYDGARALNELAVGLGELCMFDECMVVQKWAIMLARMLVDVFGDSQPNCAAFVALYLANQCSDNVFHNRIQKQQLIKEAHAITQNLRSQHAGQVSFQILHSYVLLQYADLLEDDKLSAKMYIEAIRVLENIFNVRAFTQSNLQIFHILQPGSSFFDRIFSSAPTVFSIITYASALRRMALCISQYGLHDSALGLMLLAIAVCRKLVSVYGHVHRAHRVQLAMALYSLVVIDWRIYSRMPAEEQIEIVDECIHLFQVLVDQNPLSYARMLVQALTRKAISLESLNRDAEAISTWQEAAHLAEQIVQDSRLCALTLSSLSDYFRRLKRFNDAARTEALGISKRLYEDDNAWEYMNLSGDLQRLRRYKEAVEAAQTSVTLYRRMVMAPHGVYYMRYLTEGLSKLAHCLAATGEYSESFMAWKESMNSVDKVLNHNRDATFYGSDVYLSALRTHLSISYVLEDEEECLRVSSTAVKYLRQLSEIDLPEEEDIILSLLSAEFCCAYTMTRFGRLQDARQYIDRWRRESGAISEPKAAEWCAAMIILKADVLDTQGYTEQALFVTQKVHDIVRPSIEAHQPLFEKMIGSMVQEARLQVYLVNGAEALRVAEEALGLCRDNKLDPVIGTIVLSLHGVAFTALSCGDYERAVEAAREGCNILTRPEGLDLWETSEQNISRRASLYSIVAYAEANLGNSTTAIEYAYRAVDVSLDIKDRKADISATTAERSYMETRGIVADILVATGHIAQAQEILEDRRVYFSKRVEKRMGEYRELAPILRMIGVLCCSEGRHEEGEAAAKELCQIIRTLGSAFSSLQEQVKTRLRHQTEVPILKVLNEMYEKLECSHQREVVSLFTI